MPELRRFASAGGWNFKPVVLPSLETLQKEFDGNCQPEIRSTFQRELELISKNPDPETFWGELLAFGRRLQTAGDTGTALRVYQWLQKEGPDPIQGQAALEAQALSGQGAAGRRAEVLIGSFAEQATDYRNILPMLAGFSAGRLVRSGLLLKGANSAGGIFSRGLGLRFAAGTTALAVEVLVFAAAQRALSPKIEAAFESELLGTGLTLGALKLGSAAPRFFPLRGNALAHAALGQVGIFGGILGAQYLEELLGIRPRVDGATRITDALGATVSLGVGAHLAGRLLGKNFLEPELDFNRGSLNSFAPIGKNPIPKLIDKLPPPRPP